MEKKFRALRVVAGFFKVLAWIALAGGALAAVAAVIIGALAGRAGTSSPLLAKTPFLGSVTGILSGILVGLMIVLGAMIYFVLLYAAGEIIHLGLAIEANTRETAYYLRGENIPNKG